MTTLAPPREQRSCNRALYAGAHGPGNWLDVVNDDTYPLGRTDTYGLRTNRLAAIRGFSVDTVVSLGPGDGREDVAIVHALRARSPGVGYIPVDISGGLLDLTVRTMSPHVDVPTAVLADFERDHDVIEAALERHGCGRRLFLLFGGTLGNLDLGERAFFARLRRSMKRGDLLLMDVPLAGPAWTVDGEPRLWATSYPPPFRRFLAGALLPPPSPDDVDRFVHAFADRVTLSLQENRFPGAKTITVADRRTRRLLLRLTRYEWRATIEWLTTRDWRVVDARSSLKEASDRFGMGVMLVAAR